MNTALAPSNHSPTLSPLAEETDNSGNFMYGADRLLDSVNRINKQISKNSITDNKSMEIAQNSQDGVSREEAGIYVLPPVFIAQKEKSRILEKWEGIVKNIDFEKQTFEASLKNIINKKPSLLAIIDFDDIDEEQRHLIKIGSIFYWSIFDIRKPELRRGINSFYFREIPIWKNHDMHEISSTVKVLHDKIFGNSAPKK